MKIGKIKVNNLGEKTVEIDLEDGDSIQLYGMTLTYDAEEHGYVLSAVKNTNPGDDYQENLYICPISKRSFFIKNEMAMPEETRTPEERKKALATRSAITSLVLDTELGFSMDDEPEDTGLIPEGNTP